MIGAVVVFAAAALTNPLDAAIKDAVRCPVPRADEIVVCGRREPGERSRYLSPLPPEYDRGDPRAQSVSASRNGLFDYDAGGSGSCSAAGLNGAYGCSFRDFKRWVLQRAGARDSRGPLYDK